MLKTIRRMAGGLVILLVSLLMLEACGEEARQTVGLPSPVSTFSTVAPSVPFSAQFSTTAPNLTIVRPLTTASIAPTLVTTPPDPPATTATASLSTANPPLVTPATVLPLPSVQPNLTSDVTPPPLGVAENTLKATGFNGDEAKALLIELSGQVGVRVVGSQGERKAADWLEGKYRSFGYSDVKQQSFPVNLSRVGGAANATSQNVIATRPGASSGARVLIFGGHYDSVPGTVGASDNGSGTVVTLEIAHTLAKAFPEYELRFINFGGEEVGILGSLYYVSKLSAEEKKRIVAYVNLDALGVGDRFVAIGTPQLVSLAVDTASKNGIRLESFNLQGTGAGSDHEAFIGGGIRSIFLARWLDRQLHRPGDSAERVYPQALLLGGGTAILVVQKILSITF